MKLRAGLSIVFVAVLVAASINVVSAARATVQAGGVYIFNTATKVQGTDAYLQRNNVGVLGRVHTVGLTPGHAYTVWWVTFAEPKNCSNHSCGLDDVLAAAGDPANDPVGVGVFYATGRLAAKDGSASFTAFLKNGDTSNCVPQGDGPFVVLCNPLDSAEHAEVHMVIRGHGAPIPGMVAAQLGSFSGACSINACANAQAGVFKP